MLLSDNTHLCYCTNIHPGETWTEVQAAVQQYIPRVRSRVCADRPFGIGLRLSDLASRQLLENEALKTFSRLLQEQNCYVFTVNGFPFGGFHGQRIKDRVHHPDWTSEARANYTVRLAKILSDLLPQGLDGGISTSPLSYAPWHRSEEQFRQVSRQAANRLASVAFALFEIFDQTGKFIHIDLEPEPDGIMENLATTLHTFRQYIFPALEQTARRYNISFEQLRRHVQLCYDVCHFAVMQENHERVLAELAAAEIPVGKFQLSAALRIIWQKGKEAEQLQALAHFDEPTYLHQTTARTNQNRLLRFADLPQALASSEALEASEWRVHFHVPIFLADYGLLQSTRSDIEQVLKLQQKHRYTHHLEVETYTWSVLPPPMRLPLDESIARELQWVKDFYKNVK